MSRRSPTDQASGGPQQTSGNEPTRRNLLATGDRLPLIESRPSSLSHFRLRGLWFESWFSRSSRSMLINLAQMMFSAQKTGIWKYENWTQTNSLFWTLGYGTSQTQPRHVCVWTHSEVDNGQRGESFFARTPPHAEWSVERRSGRERATAYNHPMLQGAHNWLLQALLEDFVAISLSLSSTNHFEKIPCGVDPKHTGTRRPARPVPCSNARALARSSAHTPPPPHSLYYHLHRSNNICLLFSQKPSTTTTTNRQPRKS